MRIRAYSVDHERWHIARTRCACGGTLVPGTQTLVMEGEAPLDVIEVTCNQCGSAAELTVDISPFYGRVKEQAELEQALAAVPEKVRKKILRRLRPPMVRTLAFAQQLTNDGDTSALDYLRETIEAARP